ncbi:TlpA family protein disulfide reductase [Rhodohalobacter sulfatireducens]|uniref:Peroxiredoxin family protein n=1 Tax=Rhodohalobacter sulfatireducens TaxID=2911366 RepID=A0ABS9KEC1_9BACT|nr:redoxin domain-containing protein [Rhodohalobacter sulfatireducens]MCG2589186.1 peroxiredoxin family protein [Rhodohalobacter sulfatireducens]
MKKTVLKWIVGGVVTAILLLGVLIANQLLERENRIEKISNWPDLEVETLEGEPVSTLEFYSDGPILFTYFNTACEYCRNEITDISKHTQLQRSAEIILISDESRKEIEKFRNDLKIIENTEFIFLRDVKKRVKEFYGIMGVPSTYLYNGDGELVQLFRGETKAELLFSTIRKDN